MKKHLILFILGLSFSLLSFSQDRAEVIRQKLLTCDESEVLVVAHRGDWRYSVENSLPAIENCIKMGVDIVELDIQRTKDGHLILMHDSKLDRTTSGKGNVSDWTLDSIKTLKLRNGCAIKTKEIVPTLEEALILAKGKIMINLDKADRYFDEVYALLKKTGTEHQIIMKGGKPYDEVKKQFGKYLDEIIYMPVISIETENDRKKVETFVREMSPVAFELIYSNDSNPIPVKVRDMLKGKSLIWYNTLWASMCGGHDDDAALENRNEAYGYLIDNLGCRIIQTDRPAYLLEYLRARDLHE